MAKEKQRLRTLILDDIEDDALLLVEMLETSNYLPEWRRVESHDEFIDAIKTPWDIIFSGFSMPKINSLDALRLLREHDQETPFIIISGTIGEEAAVEAMRYGAQDYVLKGNWARLIPSIARELREQEHRRKQRQAEDHIRKLSSVVNQANDSVFITDPYGIIEYVNPAFERLTGYCASDAIGKSSSILQSGLHSKAFYNELWQTISNGKEYRATLVNRRSNGELFYEEKTITPLKDDEGKITNFVSTGRDITSRIKAEAAQKQLGTVLESTPDLVSIIKPNGQLRHLNGAWRQHLNISVGQDIDKLNMEEVLPAELVQCISTLIPALKEKPSWEGEVVLTLPSGMKIPVLHIVQAHYDMEGRLDFISSIAHDVSQLKRFEEQLEHQATHDFLTELPNRYYLLVRGRSMLSDAQRKNKRVAVLFMDMNNFKRINDTLGHDVGDKYLKQVADRLHSCSRGSDIICRHGGDEFAVLLNDLDKEEDTLYCLKRLYDVFKVPFNVDAHELYATFSTGIALYPNDGSTLEELLHNADTAMYQAKTSEGNQYRFYSPDMNAKSHELLTLESELRRALEQNEFELYIQPQIDIATGQVIGGEALIRWQHPTRGTLPPADFITLLENSGLIIPVGEWVLRQTCLIHRTWRNQGFGHMRISVNISAVQFDSETFLEKVRTIIREEEMAIDKLEIEVTENVAMRNPNKSTQIIQSLRDIGVRTAIDDFGTGYSSLAYLNMFPLTVLKIDRVFVAGLFSNSGNAIVEASISLAQKLGLETVAEGVETKEQLHFLQQHGCNIAQGYYTGHPLPAEDFSRHYFQKQSTPVCS